MMGLVLPWRRRRKKLHLVRRQGDVLAISFMRRRYSRAFLAFELRRITHDHDHGVGFLCVAAGPIDRVDVLAVQQEALGIPGKTARFELACNAFEDGHEVVTDTEVVSE